MNDGLNEYLVKQSSKLPPQQLREVIDFTEFLLSKEAATSGAVNGGSAHSLRRFVGGVSHGSLANRIDDELYGATVH